MSSNKLDAEYFIGRIQEFHRDFLYVPKILHVKAATYKDLYHEMFHDLRVHGLTWVALLELHAGCGRVIIQIDDDQIEGCDYYFDDDKWAWLDMIAEKILLRGEEDDVVDYRRSTPQNI